MRNRLRPALTAGFLACVAGDALCAADALAQTFSGLGPAPVFVLPQPGARAPLPEVAAVPAAARSAPVQDRGPRLRRLPAGAAPLRLWGENGSLTFAFYATEAEARAGGRFQVGYLAAVSILPEASRLSVGLNGATLGGAPIDGVRGARTVGFDVPPGALVRGYNRIDLAVAQRHRVDCSVAATYELWTQIDADTTGLLSGAEEPADPADLPAIRGGFDGAVPVRLIQTGERLSERGVERILGALQSAVLVGRFAQPAADFGPTAEAGDGLALAVGSAADLTGHVDPAELGPITGPRLALLPRTAEHRPVLVVTGRDDAEVAAALADLARLRAAEPVGAPAGLRALADARGRRVEGGETITLADLGLADAHVAARTHRIALDLDLPHDFLPADYDRIVLDVDAAYPAGLVQGAQIVVEINGRNAASAPLGRPGGEAMNRRSIFLPLGLLRPGLNRIAIQAELPRADDRACASEAGTPTERLHLAATTRLTIPPLARIGRQPEIAATVAAAVPYAASARRPTLVVPSPDRDTMAAAATLAAKLGLAAGRPIPFAFAAGRTVFASAGVAGSGLAGPSLVVSAAKPLDAATLAAAHIDPQALHDAWASREPGAAPRDGGPAQRRRILRKDGIAACRGRNLAGAEPVAEADKAGGGPTLKAASAVIAQGVTGPGRDDLLTLVTAPSAAALREAVDCLADPRVWRRPAGRLAALSSVDGTVAVEAENAPRYIATAPPAPGNLRRIAAGWLSLHAGLYGLFGLLVAGGLAGSTQVLVRNLGRKPQ
ncbi:cellulose biosynthesis cyclic di-GMP-binding regulatory protein BcsB [Methylobacterium sp. NEAU 140]|uniref:cellulose biosynthesis cyclic di-GMP-binding regulatory protein BcsB n=1 Tax=Methylobacterium sp. NEAU 140 TaxID=3064945 RepID=UPI0027370CAF|nr:cellulose biosynthesis cyclic di-GMP-binding regulatory protein BcsB [Methylobacterium sp. NEAU 140]MDP4023017.1 cellulose biosynthesis cyclic di-GMP-binding regulatory protein BcsB [Methylobacterium sp. NEAU 140]